MTKNRAVRVSIFEEGSTAVGSGRLITKNKESTLYLNMPLAGRMGIKFPMDTIERAILLTKPAKDN